MKRKLIQKLFLCATLAISVAALLSFPFLAIAKTLKYSSPQDITIKAVVPLLPDYKFLISKNSKILIADKSVRPGEKIDFTVELLGFQDKSLINQSAFVIIKNDKDGKVMEVFPYSMDSKTGIAKFSLENSADLLGKNIIQAFISTYGEPIKLKKEASFTVKEPNLFSRIFE